jgi:hypothetical protein
MLPRKTFIYFLLDTPTGKAYYRDKNGTLKIQIITADSDVSLKNAPANWLDTELSFSRNATYHGIARSYSTPQEFVRDAATMIKELFLLGVGTEVPLTLAVFKYNSQPLAGEPQYKLYFKANLDLPKISETVLESLTTNLMEGGVTQLLKSYEGTTVTIPCDGQIAENQKVNLDGLLVSDVFYYQVIPMLDYEVTDAKLNSFTELGCTFINNEGDNYGIIHQDQTINIVGYAGSIDPNQIKNYAKTSQNYLFMSVAGLDVRITGSVMLMFNNPCSAQIFLVTTSQYIAATDNIFGNNHSSISLNFDQKVTLAANEPLFIFIQIQKVFQGDNLDNMVDILGGSFSIAFQSMAKATRPWAIQAYDLFKLILSEINLLSSTQFQTFNYQAVSSLLASSSIFFTSGDALRASGDNTYQRFYSLSQTNQILQQSYGPVIKTTLRDFFQSIETILVAELNAGHNGAETLEIEALDSIYDSSVVDFSIGEIASLKWNFAEDLGFSDLEIGYPPQTYDQKAGKYEYNTTLEMKAPIKSFSKKLSKISKIRFDSYGIEKLRSNVEGTSTTRNDSDNSVFGINVDTSKYIQDYFSANFTSINTDVSDPLNTNKEYAQTNGIPFPLPMPITDGEYFQQSVDNAIVIFSDAALNQTFSCSLVLAGYVNSVNKPPLAPADTFTLKFFINGQLIYTHSTTVTGINTDIGFTFNFSQLLKYRDNLYITLETSASAEVTINTCTLTVGSYVTLQALNVPVLSGTFKLLSWATASPTSSPYTIGTSVVQYGFQYFTYVSNNLNRNFTLTGEFKGLGYGSFTVMQIYVYVNGVLQGNDVNIATNGDAQPFDQILEPISITYNVNDIVFFVVTMPGADSFTNLVYLTYANINFASQIKAYSLKRVHYDSLSGIPNLAKNSSGEIRTDIAGAPYNIEDLTPKTLLRKWQNYIMSCFMDQVTGTMTFQTLSKNSYLSRSVNGQTITENSDEPILGFTRLFYPIELEMKTNVPQGFAELMNKTKNAHVHATFMGTDIYFFADSLKQKPALNESQTWKGIMSPKTDLTAFSKINSFKIPDMAPNSISCAFASPVQFVPYNQTLQSKYHTYNRDTFLYIYQTDLWDKKDNYLLPVQIGDHIPLQFITNGLSPVSYSVYNCNGSLFSGPVNLNVVSSPAVNNPYTLFQGVIDTTSWPGGDYYIMISAGSGGLASSLISELLHVDTADQMRYTTLIEYTHSSNTQGIVFDAGFVGSMRIKGGFDNMFKQKYLGKFYVDQPQDITVLNAIPYEVTTLLIGTDGGVPDYLTKKILRMLLMDGCTLDGEGFTLNEGAQFEEVFTEGSPLKMQKIDIRPTKNLNGINVIAAGVDSDSSLIVSVNPQSFGPNVSNSSGTTETDLINITVGN